MSLPHAWITKDFLFIRDRFGLVVQLTHEDANKLRHALPLMLEVDELDENRRQTRRVLEGVP